MSNVVVTGMGALSPLGNSTQELWAAIMRGEDGIRSVDRFDASAYAIQLAGSLRDPRWTQKLRPLGQVHEIDPCGQAAIDAAVQAWNDAALDQFSLDRSRVAVVLGTSSAGLYSRSSYEFMSIDQVERRHALLDASGFQKQADVVARALQITGPRMTMSTACTSSTHAIAMGLDLLRARQVDVVLAGGVDLIVEEAFAGFYAMGAMCPVPCAPFSDPLGMSLGEGAGFLVLEAEDHARARCAPHRVYLRGYGLALDGYHATAPDPTGAGISRALRHALADADVQVENVGYINAHGTGTDANDPAEWRAVRTVFGPYASQLPVSSTKSYFGHALGAAGVLEAIVTIQSLREQVVPPTLHFRTPRADSPSDPVPDPVPRTHAYDVAVSNNAAFGGVNAALVFARSHTSTTRSNTTRALRVRGLGVVGPHGVQGLAAALSESNVYWLKPLPASERGEALPPSAGLVPPFAIERIVRGMDPRNVDRLSSFVTAAAALALQSAGIKVKGSMRESVGVSIGIAGLSPDTIDLFWDSIRERGFPKVSTLAFARMVVNAPLGVASRALDLHGPASVFAGGNGSTFNALWNARNALISRSDANHYLVGGACALSRARLTDHARTRSLSAEDRAPFGVYGTSRDRLAMSEGASMVLLTRDETALGAHEVWLKSVSLGGPDGLLNVIRMALADASVDADEVDAIVGCASGLVRDAACELHALEQVLGARLKEVPLYNAAPRFGSMECADAWGLAVAVELLRSGEVWPSAHPEVEGLCLNARRHGHVVRTVLLVHSDDLSGSGAAVLSLDRDGRENRG